MVSNKIENEMFASDDALMLHGSELVGWHTCGITARPRRPAGPSKPN